MTTRAFRIAFTDSAFRRSHGSSPRGRGCWAFQASTGFTALDRELYGEILWSPSNMTLTEAKAWARLQVPADAVEAILAVLP